MVITDWDVCPKCLRQHPGTICISADEYAWPGDNKSQAERALSAEYELDKAVSDINKLRAALAMRNSDVQELIRVLTKTLKFYDDLNVEHETGEAKLLDEIATAIRDYCPPRTGCGDPNCTDANCDYGK